MTNDKTRLSLACNDYRNGMFAGRFESAQFEFHDESELEVNCWPTRVKELNSAVRVGRIVVPTYGGREWWGNWCWNLYIVSSEDAFKILEYLCQKRHANYEQVSEGWAAKCWNTANPNGRLV